MMDNAPPHKAKSTKPVFEQARIPILPWPPSSPDLNPIENIWGIIKHRLDARRAQLTTREEVIAVIQEEWDRISARELQLYIDSMPRRIQQVIEARGAQSRGKSRNTTCHSLFLPQHGGKRLGNPDQAVL